MMDGSYLLGVIPGFQAIHNYGFAGIQVGSGLVGLLRIRQVIPLYKLPLMSPDSGMDETGWVAES